MNAQRQSIIEFLKQDSDITDLLDTDNQSNALVIDDASDLKPRTRLVYVELEGGPHPNDKIRRSNYTMNVYSCADTLHNAEDIDQVVYDRLQYNEDRLNVSGVTLYSINCIGGPRVRTNLVTILFSQKNWINIQRTYLMSLSD